MAKKITKRVKNDSIESAFRELTKKGYTTVRGLADCRTCGWAELGEQEAEKAVFTTDQSEDDYKKTGELYLDWSGSGAVIVKALKKHGLTVEWEGTRDRRIIIK